MLKSQCATMLIISQAVNNLQEVVLPFVTKFYMTKVAQLKTMFSFGRKKDDYDMKKTFVVGDHCNPFQYIPELQMDDPRIEAAIREGELEDYEGTYDDYLEMYIQFGYVVLFSSVYPIAAFWAILNNILEIRADAFKLCMVFQRPLGRRVKDIGAWQRAFEVVGAMSILTNCGVLCLSPQMRRAGPDVGRSGVRVALAKRNHESKQALKYERAQRNRRLLTRRFKSVHGLHGQ
ncbi:Calcium-activated chloride channel [Popillia japonica]|uniref:Anoctamin n=1 Tax=Popillia japonica TaxID=7064 RepID=A0AAW1JXK2_POPJA